MNFLIVDASKKKAAIRSRRILSAWLPQVGEDAYLGKLSQEGLSDLVRALKATPSRNTSVAIHRIGSNGASELVTIIGNKAFFDSEGHWAFRTKGLKSRNTNDNAVLQILVELVVLAGLLHDIGKINLLFQRSLRVGFCPQPLRHEVISFVLLERMLVESGSESDKEFLSAAMSRPDSLFENLVVGDTIVLPTWLEGYQNSISAAQVEANKMVEGYFVRDDCRGDFPLMTALLWLVLTHHHPIQPAKDKGGLGNPSTWRHIQDLSGLSEAADPGLIELNEKTLLEAAPWRQKRWLAAFVRCVSALHGLLENNPTAANLVSKNYQSLAPVAHSVLRPALILGDQSASAIQWDLLRENREFKSDVLYAKSEGDPKAARPGDTLETHLISASRRSRAALNVLLGAHPHEELFSSLSETELASSSLMTATPPASSPFAWQDEASRTLAAKDISQNYFFGAVLAEPGSGKTIAGPRLMMAASGGDLRLTFAQGLRSLTQQTGKAFTDPRKIGAPEHSVATLVGDAAAKMLFSASERMDSTGRGAAQGSECLAREEEEFLTFVAESEFEPSYTWREVICPSKDINSSFKGKRSNVFSEKISNFIDRPIVVCTVDHLIPAALMLRNADVARVLRVASSDLILDELDNYQQDDLIALARLVHMHGMYGRRVLLMSGTLPQTIVAHLYQAWLEGIKLHKLMTGATRPVTAILASNRTPLKVLHEMEPTEFDEASLKFAKELAAAIDDKGSKVRAAALPIERLEGWESAVLTGCMALHRDNCVPDPETGKHFSAGFVRFNKVARAQALATHLLSAEMPLDTEVRVVCYHSRYPAIVRYMIERFMDKALSRADDPIPQHKLIREALAGSTKQNLILIVCTTSIEETGRDHDFDWAIAEPSSARSLSQCAGRIKRHRAHNPSCPNLLVLSTTIAALESPGNRPYGRAGIQDDDYFKETDHWLQRAPRPNSKLSQDLSAVGIPATPGDGAVTLEAEELLPSAFWGRYLTTAQTLTTPTCYEENRLGSLEYIGLQRRLAGMGRHDSLAALLRPSPNSNLWFDVRHARLWGFRKSKMQEIEVCMGGVSPDTFYLIDEETGLPSNRIVRHATVSFKHPERALLTELCDIEDAVSQFCKDSKCEWRVSSAVLGKMSLRKPYSHRGESLQFSYHPLIGAAHS